MEQQQIEVVTVIVLNQSKASQFIPINKYQENMEGELEQYYSILLVGELQEYEVPNCDADYVIGAGDEYAGTGEKIDDQSLGEKLLEAKSDVLPQKLVIYGDENDVENYDGFQVVDEGNCQANSFNAVRGGDDEYQVLLNRNWLNVRLLCCVSGEFIQGESNDELREFYASKFQSVISDEVFDSDPVSLVPKSFTSLRY
ncbi:MAG: hypothetical protein EZS28_002645 [Streblomastix strix]|uniref:Uncharacterized protein n=1 Tax=Streblomastix strix TaxID=222440 RepID=A0A5J4X4C0_9EUKA|nr:MAG: hypothetical protein EZS28_002645 [Streblomastix strix]